MTYILAAGPPITVEVTGPEAQLVAVIEASDLVIRWGLPPNGGSEILEGQIEIQHSDGTGFSEEIGDCHLAEDSTPFDSRECSIPLSSMRLNEPNANAY